MAQKALQKPRDQLISAPEVLRRLNDRVMDAAPDALEAIIELARGATSEQVRLAASKELVARVEALASSSGGPSDDSTDVEIEKLIVKLSRTRSQSLQRPPEPGQAVLEATGTMDVPGDTL